MSWRGTQYVSVLVGWAGPNPYGHGLMPTGWRYNAQPRRLLTFRLGGRARLPATAPYDESVHPLDDPAIVLDPAKVAAGNTLYHGACHGCHGGQVELSGAPGPDLRESAIALDREMFTKVVREGASLPARHAALPRLQRRAARPDLQLHPRTGTRDRPRQGSPSYARSERRDLNPLAQSLMTISIVT